MTPAVLLAVRPLPPLPIEDIEAHIERLSARLSASFASAENRPYLDALHRGPLSSVRQRMEALCLLPPLLTAAGVDTAALCLVRDDHSRPYLAIAGERDKRRISGMDFNLSHTATYVVCGLSIHAGAIGVDVEGPIPDDRCRRLTERYATPGERRLLAADTGMDFSRLWATREALGKREGRGRPLERDAACIPSDTAVRVYRLPGGTTLALAMEAALPSDTLRMIDVPNGIQPDP